MIYTNNKWKVRNRDYTITEIIDDKEVISAKSSGMGNQLK